MMQCDAFIELAYLSWLFSPREGPMTVLHPVFLICEASLIASVLAGVPMCAIRIKVELICGRAIFSLLRLSITLSNPIPNPIPGVLGPPICSISPSYLPPPAITLVLPSTGGDISNTVRE